MQRIGYTVEELQRMSASQNMLLLLRTLIAGDGMTQTYELLQKETIRDIVKMCEDLLDADGEDADLGDDARVEFNQYLIRLKVYYEV